MVEFISSDFEEVIDKESNLSSESNAIYLMLQHIAEMERPRMTNSSAYFATASQTRCIQWIRMLSKKMTGKIDPILAVGRISLRANSYVSVQMPCPSNKSEFANGF